MNFGDPVEITRHDICFAIAEARVQMPRRDISLVRIDTQDGAARLPRAVLIKLRKGPADAAAGQVRIHGQRVQDHDLAVFGRIQPVPVRIDVDLPLVDDAGGRHAAVKLADIQVAPVQRVLRILPDRIDPRDPADRRQPGILPGVDLIIDRFRGVKIARFSFPKCQCVVSRGVSSSFP